MPPWRDDLALSAVVCTVAILLRHVSSWPHGHRHEYLKRKPRQLAPSSPEFFSSDWPQRVTELPPTHVLWVFGCLNSFIDTLSNGELEEEDELMHWSDAMQDLLRKACIKVVMNLPMLVQTFWKCEVLSAHNCQID